VHSLKGINSILPFYLLAKLRIVYVSDFTDDRSKKTFLSALGTALASGSSATLAKLTLKATIWPQLTLLLPTMSTLNDLTLAFSAPVKMECFVFLNSIPHLKTLSLAIYGTNDAIYPEAGKQLMKTHPEQRKSKIMSLTVEGDPFFIFWSASFFCGPSVHTFVGKVSTNLRHRLTLGLLLVPHMLEMDMVNNPKVQKLSIEWDGELSGNEPWNWEDERVALSDSFYPTLSTLRNITALSLKNIPMTRFNFFPQVLASLPALPSLCTLSLVPLHVADEILPTPDDLATIRTKFPSLQHLTISLQHLPDVPQDLPDMMHPGHGLKSLFVVPGHDEEVPNIHMSTLIPLATYLDRLFPQLSDVTSYFQKGNQRAFLGSMLSLDQLLKLYQKIRREAVQFNQNLSTVAGRASTSEAVQESCYHDDICVFTNLPFALVHAVLKSLHFRVFYYVYV
jgi:hypothetical protein